MLSLFVFNKTKDGYMNINSFSNLLVTPREILLQLQTQCQKDETDLANLNKAVATFKNSMDKFKEKLPLVENGTLRYHRTEHRFYQYQLNSDIPQLDEVAIDYVTAKINKISEEIISIMHKMDDNNNNYNNNNTDNNNNLKNIVTKFFIDLMDDDVTEIDEKDVSETDESDLSETDEVAKDADKKFLEEDEEDILDADEIVRKYENNIDRMLKKLEKVTLGLFLSQEEKNAEALFKSKDTFLSLEERSI